jgi:hypothetical protein
MSLSSLSWHGYVLSTLLLSTVSLPHRHHFPLSTSTISLSGQHVLNSSHSSDTTSVSVFVEASLISEEVQSIR